MIEQIPLLNDLPEGVRGFVARILLFLLVFLIIWLFRRVFAMIIVRPLRRVARNNHYSGDDTIIDAVMLPVRYFIIAFALMLGVEILGVGDQIDVAIQNIGRSLVIFSVLTLIYRLVDLFAPTSNRLLVVTGLQIEERLLPFLRTSVKLIIIAIGMVIILQEWGYDVSGLIAGFGLGGLAFSLAAQDTISNLFGFTAIVSDDPFDIGEYIKTPDVEGLVEHVGLRSTRVRQLDQAVVYVPNSKLANSAILNWSRLSKRRIDYILGITYDAKSGELRVLLHRLREMLRSQQTLDPDSVVVYFINFGDSSLEVLVRAYVNIKDWGEFTAEKERLYLEVMDIVDELGMSIAFPSTSIYVENLPPMMNLADAGLSAEGEPRLTARERALMRGDYYEKPDVPKGSDDPEENVTGQQDEK